MPHDDEHARIECGVLQEVIELHPDHLTPPELVLRVATDRDESEGEAILHAIRDLRSSGLLGYVDDVVAPTHTALRAAALLH